MKEAEIDANLAWLRELANQAAIEAIKTSAKATALGHEFEALGFRMLLTVGMALRRIVPTADQRPPAADAGKLANQRRPCPCCSTHAVAVPMRGHVVRDRVAGAGEHDVIEGAQVRFTCSACGYGEVVPVAAEA